MGLSRSEIEALLPSLPLKKIQIAGKDRLIRYDKDSGMAYLVEDDGITYTGKSSKIRTPAAQDESKPEPEQAAGADEKKAPKAEKEKKPKKEKVKKEKPAKDPSSAADDQEAKKKKALLFIAFVAVILVVVYVVTNSAGTPSKPSAGGDAPLETVDVAALAAAEKYECLIVTRNMYQGEEITEKDLATCVLSKVEYAQCGGVYPASCKGDIVGMHMTKFLPFGALLQYDTCTYNSTYSISPWSSLDDTHTYLDIPIQVDITHLDDYIPGDTIRLVISRDTKSKTSTAPEGTSTDGMDYTSRVSASITTDVFTFERIQIADFLNAKKMSIYTSNSRFYSVPEGYLSSTIINEFDKENYTNMVPTTLRVIVTKEQAKVIGSLPAESIRLEMKLVESAPEDYIPEYNRLTSRINKYMIARYNQIVKQLQEEAKKNGNR